MQKVSFHINFTKKLTCFSLLPSPEGLAFNCLSMASITVRRSVNIWIINVFSMAILWRIPVTDHYEMKVCKQCLRAQTSVDIVLGPTKKLNLTVIQKVNLGLKLYSVPTCIISHRQRASLTWCQLFNSACLFLSVSVQLHMGQVLIFMFFKFEIIYILLGNGSKQICHNMILIPPFHCSCCFQDKGAVRSAAVLKKHIDMLIRGWQV